MEAKYDQLHRQYEAQAVNITQLRQGSDTAMLGAALRQYAQTQREIGNYRTYVSKWIDEKHYSPDKNDTNYVFLYFVKNALPKGIVGLLFAVIILASWGSISAALNSLSASSLMDVQMMGCDPLPLKEQVMYGRAHTLGWGIFCIGVAMFAQGSAR